MSPVRIIGDVHGQIDAENLSSRGARPYLEVLNGADYSIQVGDMGDKETYDALERYVDADRHRFFPGNHDHYDRLPPHSLGDFGAVKWGGVEFFFIRGAASVDREDLIRLGQRLGKTLWFPQEELTDEEMQAAEREYLRVRPKIVLSHDAPRDISFFAWQHASRVGPFPTKGEFRPSRTNSFLARLREQHTPRLWAFGHHHRDWRYRANGTLFVCVGELSYVDIDSNGNVLVDNT